MNLRRLLLFGLLVLAGFLNAQTDYRPGYIISTHGDTLFGELDYRSDLLMSSLCKFKDADHNIKKYSPDDIKAFRFIDSKYFVSREVNSKQVFLEYLIKGKVNIYYMRDELGDHYYIDKEDLKLTEITYEEGIKYIDNKQVYYQSTKHMGLLSIYMQDAPEFKPRIHDIKKPEHKNLIKLAEDYHNTVCEGEQCIIYEKTIPLLKILPELIGGAIKYSDVTELNNKFYFHGGIIGHLWMPRHSEKLYFRTGLLFSQLEFEKEVLNYYKIPFQIEYMYPTGLFRPRIAYGLNFYIPYYQTVSFDLGANIKLSESLFLSATSDIEFNPALMIVPNKLLSYSLKLGLILNIQ